jgi:hypothetical protein
MTAQLDDFLVRHAPAPLQPIEPGALAARAQVRETLRALAGVADSALERPWPWRDGEVDIRYGVYRQYEALEEARAAIRPLLAGLARLEPPARPMLGAAAAARWELNGVLVGVSDEELDRDPGGGEWTLRQAIGHIIGGQRGYNWGSAWWLSRRDAPPEDYPKYIPEDVSIGMPSDDQEADGTLAELRTRLDDMLDQGTVLFAGLSADDMGVRARWSGIAVDIRFRLFRWASHIREHTVQVEKTLVMLGRPMSEAERIVRLVAAAYGRLEAELWGWPAEPALAKAWAEVGRRLEQVRTDAYAVARAASG